MRGQIYLISNNINGRMYVGQATGQGIRKGYLGSGLIIKKAIKKHGLENFTKEILWDGEITREELNNLEIKYISDHNTLVSLGGYNIAIGGMGNSGQAGRKASEETKIKISDARMGMKFSDEHKNNLAKAKIGTKQSDITKTKRAISRNGKIVNIDGILYGTQGIASFHTGINIRTLCRRLKDKKFPNIVLINYCDQDNVIGLI